MIYTNIGSALYNMGDYDSALDNFQKALDIQKEVLGRNHPDTASAFNNLGAVYEEKMMYDTALQWFLESYKIRLSKLGYAHTNTLITKQNMELVYNKIGNPTPFESWLHEQLLKEE